jgi:hypothetical protein
MNIASAKIAPNIFLSFIYRVLLRFFHLYRSRRRGRAFSVTQDAGGDRRARREGDKRDQNVAACVFEKHRRACEGAGRNAAVALSRAEDQRAETEEKGAVCRAESCERRLFTVPAHSLRPFVHGGDPLGSRPHDISSFRNLQKVFIKT